MSAELYDAEMAGALARPAVDVLPVHTSRKDRAVDVLPGAPQPPVADPTPEPTLEPTAELDEPAEPVAEAAQAPVAEVEPVAEPAPRKVFGLALSRGRRAKPEPEAVDPVADDATEADAQPVPLLEDDIDVPTLAPAGEPAAEPIWDLGAPTVTEAHVDHDEEIRALKALLESSENLRQEAEARTAAAEAASRTAANGVQEWQIRHREAEATISELAGSLAGAEGRMAELHQQVQALETERDELVAQLDAATSPTA